MPMIMNGFNSNNFFFLLLCASILCKFILQFHSVAAEGNKLTRTLSQKLGHHDFCKAPAFVPKNASMPQQVHLALTSQPGEMNITWITFNDDEHPEGVFTFVQYWEIKNSDKKIILKANRKRHTYTDNIDIACSKADKPKNWNQINDNIRFIHTVILTGLADNKRYEYEVGYCVPAKLLNGNECICVPEIGDGGRACTLRYREKIFNFKMFPWHRNGDDTDPFTIVVFGDLGLKKLNKGTKDKERSNEESAHFDSMAPQSMQALIELVHRPHNLDHPMIKDKKQREHPICRSHLNANSSGLEMNNVQMILHIGDIAYDMHEWRTRKERTEKGALKKTLYNVGDRFMNVAEDVAAYVPYMVLAGNHENEENKSQKSGPLGAEAHFDPQYEHYESRYNMPRNFHGHDTNQFYQNMQIALFARFVYGPIWFICISTEFYYSYKTIKPTFKWNPDFEKVKHQYDFIEYNLIKANMQRDKYPWVVVVQHRPFHCTSTEEFTCKGNTNHKIGVPHPDDPTKLVYGLEELFNKYNVDLVITGHEHTYEMFPPIQLHKDKNRVIPHKYWWHAKRQTKVEEPKRQTKIQEPLKGQKVPEPLKGQKVPEPLKGQKVPEPPKGQKVPEPPKVRKFPEPPKGQKIPEPPKGQTKVQQTKDKTNVREHQFMAYTDPIAPTYVIVGRPGNEEKMERLKKIAQLQRVKQYNPFSITLLHYPGKRAKKSLISIRQVDIRNGYVPLEFALEKTFALYDKQLICHAIDREDLESHHKEKRSIFWLEPGDIIEQKRAFTADEKFRRKDLENPEEFSMFYMEEMIEPRLLVEMQHNGKTKETTILSLTKIKQVVQKPMVLTQKWPKRWYERVKMIEAEYAKENKEYQRKKEFDKIKYRSVQEHPKWFTPEELVEINREMQEGIETAVPKQIVRRSKSEPKAEKLEKLITDKDLKKVQQKLMMHDPEKLLITNQELMEMQQNLLMQEIGDDAGGNSKLRALLHAYNMKWAHPNDPHLSSLYQMAKFKVCELDNKLSSPALISVKNFDEQVLVRMKFMDERYKELEERFSANPGKKNKDHYIPYRQSLLASVPVKIGNLPNGVASTRSISPSNAKSKRIIPNKAQKPINATPLQNINWNRLEMREFANILAFYYLAAFFHVGIGQCAKLPMFHNSGTEDFYNPGQTKIWLGHEEVQNLLKAPTGANSTPKEDKQNTPCFGIDYFEKYGNDAFEVPKELRTYLWVKEKLVLSKKRHEYSTKLAQMLNARSISLSSAEFDTKEEVHDPGHIPSKFVSPSVVLKKIQENSLEKSNFFTKQKVQWMVVDDPELVQLIPHIFH